MDYKILNDNIVLRLTDNANIPVDTANADYQTYLQWLSRGNTPEPADPVPNPRIAELKAELAALDIRRIRPTAEGDTAYLAILNAQAAVLRAELQALQ